MIRVEAIAEFNLKDFAKLKNIERKGKAEEGKLFIGDTFDCDEEMFKYLTETNKLNRAFVKAIEVIPEVKEEPVKEIEIPEVAEQKEKPKEVSLKKKPKKK